MFTPCYKIIFVTYLFHAAFGMCACISSLLHGKKPCLIDAVTCGTWWWNCWTAKRISGQERSDLVRFVRALHIASSSFQSAAWRMTCNMACLPPTCIHTLSPRRKSDMDQHHPVIFPKVHESVVVVFLRIHLPYQLSLQQEWCSLRQECALFGRSGALSHRGSSLT